MKNVKYIKYFLPLYLVGILVTIGVYWSKGLIDCAGDIDPDVVSSFGSFVGGFWGTLVSLGVAYLVFLTYQSQKEEFEAMRVNAEKQAFETTLFNLINNFNNVKREIEIDDNDSPQRRFNITTLEYKNYKAIIKINEDIKNALELHLNKTPSEFLFKEDLKKDYVETIQQMYEGGIDLTYNENKKLILNIIFNNYESHLSQYFKLFQVIVGFIQNRVLSNSELNIYKTIIKAQLSNEDLKLLNSKSQIDSGIKNAVLFLDAEVMHQNF